MDNEALYMTIATLSSERSSLLMQKHQLEIENKQLKELVQELQSKSEEGENA